MKPIRIGEIVPLFAIFVVLIFSCGCNKNDDFNIVGNWRIHAASTDGTMDEDYFLSFLGNEWSGDIYEGGVDIGDYIVFAKTVFIRNVAFSFRYYMSEPLGYLQLSFGCEVHSGHDDMNGSFLSFFTNSPENMITGNWTGTRL
jgi:hypothetical protein